MRCTESVSQNGTESNATRPKRHGEFTFCTCNKTIVTEFLVALSPTPAEPKEAEAEERERQRAKNVYGATCACYIIYETIVTMNRGRLLYISTVIYVLNSLT